MTMNFFSIFDAIITLLGAYLLFTGIKGYKKGEVDPMVVTTEELTRCGDIKGLSAYLMPKCAIFGAFCIIFGVQGLLNDSQFIAFPKFVNVIFLIAFVVVWILFSAAIHKAKKQYIH
ncbi:hypothetical protein SAMN05421493_101142 [Pseudobutyrivibrio sp. 49]|uniref:hypothetical protein n=1 Tax=unclassified Pseudobutyrivibrio TaxID=2638619 RepID=UPI00088CCE17|nr:MULTISPECIES: hypothetical protein [unclassified Pseudobutyrivibrio]SDH29201.1 hypothetical protein SAMN05421493_101142 [Pseudobutyrivibrio sp. 49]SFN52371.1 hypothetical protein SAMN04487831_101541 [Pseudobutyrivibrio sp. UC1225]